MIEWHHRKIKPFFVIVGSRRAERNAPVMSVHTAAEFLWRVGSRQYEYARFPRVPMFVVRNHPAHDVSHL